MRVAIIAPPYPLSEAPAPPLGVTYIAAAGEAAGAEVRIFDYIVRKYSVEKLKADLDDFAPHVVGSTSVTLNFPQAADILSTVKRLYPEIITVMGGPHVSFTAADVLRNYPNIEIIVIGEGEATIMDLLPLIMDKKKWGLVKGIGFCLEGQVVINEPRGFISDLDALPFPARHLLPLSRYQALGYSISIITGRGCPYSCIFCQGRRMVGKKIRRRKASLVVDEIEQILSYGINRINVADDLFTSDKARVSEICGEIKKRKLRFAWSAFARVNTVDRETLEMMREAGCDAVSFGVESGNQEMLDRIKKSITLDMVRKAVNLCQEVGIIPHTSFMVGLPGETHATLKDTKAFASSLGSLYGYHFLAPFPGTTIREEINNYDLKILTEDWRLYDANSAIVSTAELTPEELNDFVAVFDKEIQSAWDEMLAGYGTTNSAETDLQVAGHFRTMLTYKLLSEDIIEACCHELGDDPEGEALVTTLCEKVYELTGMGRQLIENTINSFLDAGYIRARINGGRLTWFWTHNKHSAFLDHKGDA